ncbi:MAG: cellulase family glycosylhydrolase [Sedimentisphaerales bacterium]|nr:cellulase family glycosylhydrolase [Sedimentisphaerales bacterium]
MGKKQKPSWFYIAIPLLLFGCRGVTAEPDVTDKIPAITIKDGRFIDAQGGEVILNGINIGFGSHTGPDDTFKIFWEHGREEAFQRIRQWGFNCVRLPIFWAGVEPTCGRYDEAFLKQVDEKIAWAKKYDLYVILDMHQDLWGVGVPGARGAPPWALPAKDTPHLHEAAFWGMAYLESPRVQAAFDAFWANRKGPDGVGIQDRYALAWRHLAQRYVDEPAVIGYDLMNEPFQGSVLPGVILGSAAQMANELQKKGITLDAATPTERIELIHNIIQDDPNLYRQWLAMVDAPLKLSDAMLITPMYQRVAREIRSIDSHRLIFTTTPITANMGIASGVGRINSIDGQPDPGQVLAPHAYHEVPDILQLTVERLVAHAKGLNVPLFVGEWGNLENIDAMYQRDPLPGARLFRNMMETNKFSAAYWSYQNDLDHRPSFPGIIARPYPQRIAGELIGYDYCDDSRIFTCYWQIKPAVAGESVIFIPEVCYPQGVEVILEPKTSYRLEVIEPDRPNQRLIIPTIPNETTLKLILHPKPSS